MLSGANAQSASRRLQEMCSAVSMDNFTEAKLLELANWMLCPRWHRDKIPQGRQIARSWYLESQALYRKHKAIPTLNSAPFVLETAHPVFGLPVLLRQTSVQTPESARSSCLSNGSSTSPSWSNSLGSPPSSVSSMGSAMMKDRSLQTVYGGNEAINLTPMFQELARQKGMT